MTISEKNPLTLSVPLYEEPRGVLRVGKGRILLELVIDAHNNGESPEDIVEMYPTLEPEEVFAVVAYYLANRSEIDAYLQRCDADAAAVRTQIEASQGPGPSKEELLRRAKAKGLSL